MQMLELRGYHLDGISLGPTNLLKLGTGGVIVSGGGSPWLRGRNAHSMVAVAAISSFVLNDIFA